MAPFLLRARDMPKNVTSWRLLWVLGLVACDDFDPDITRERGDLGRGKFIYECLGETDTACADSSTSTFPQAIALNSRFAMRFAIDSGTQPTVIAGAPNFLQPFTGGFRALRVGDASLLAVNGNREVIDLKHVRTATITQVRVRRGNSLPESELDLQTGDSVELTAVPFDALGVELGGALDYAWKAQDPEIVHVETLADLNRVRIRVLKAGDTMLTVTAGGQELSLRVRVDGDTVEPDAGHWDRDGGAEDSGAPENDAGVETDGGDV